MKRYLGMLFMLLVLGGSTKAQYQLGLVSSNYSGTNSIFLNPSNTVDSRFKLYINAFSFGMHFSNDYVSWNAPYHPFATIPGLNTLYKVDPAYQTSSGEPDFNNSYIKENVNGELKNIFVQNDIKLFNTLININAKNAIAFGARQRSMLQMTDISEPFARFVRWGFKTSAPPFQNGELDSLSPYTNNSFNINVLTMTEFSFSYGRVVVNDKEHFLKAGITGKYFLPQYALYLRNENTGALVYNDDSFDILNTDFSYGYTNDRYYTDGNAPFGTGLGKGFGVDIGVTYEYRPNYKKYDYTMDNKKRQDESKNKYLFKVGASINDVGSVKFQNSDYVRAYTLNNKAFVTLQQAELNTVLDNVSQYGAMAAIDSLLDRRIGLATRANQFSMALPSHLAITADWNVYRGFYLNATYIQTLRSRDVNGLRGFSSISVTPRYESRWFDFAVPVQFTQDFSRVRLGAYMRGGPFWVGTDNLNSIISKKEIAGADIYFGISIPLHRKKPKDKDKDGVSNRKDKCKDIPGVWMFAGCPDTDMDSIPDTEDSCVDVAGIKALHGCPDADGDGITDADDRCPENAGPAYLNGCPDMDGDSIPDIDDACPELAGERVNKGCPDRDQDGILDMNDSCPDKPGLKEFNGCPDRDGDKVPDHLDKCPDVKGLVDMQGCPDTDGDKVPDHVDLCPLTPGLPENNGCPKVEEKIEIVEISEEEQEVLNEVFSNLEFATGSSTISASSFESLDLLAELLTKKPAYKIYVAGHTDNVGKAASNLKLSQERAEAVKNYLKDKGIGAERIKTEGFGQERPVADNETPEGRQKNRRVEFRIIK
ncbi:MAG: hypothetical protein EP332_11475 [Bacteroidetes bacterium]|nr:MAG: hypothetical protein EP332_11475 [Bacteroidota bacterium]